MNTESAEDVIRRAVLQWIADGPSGDSSAADVGRLLGLIPPSGAIDASAVLDTLVHEGLLELRPGPEGETRYRVTPAGRQFAQRPEPDR